MRDKLILANIRELVTLSGVFSSPENPLGVLRDACVAMDEGVIAYAGDFSSIPASLLDSEVMDADDLTVMPGLVDCHTHLVFAGNRADEYLMKLSGVPYMEIAQRGGGILATVEATRKASLEELIALGLPRLKRALARGITTVEIKSGYGLDTETELKQLEAIDALSQLQPVEIVPTFMGAHEFPPEFRGDEGKKERYVDLLCEEMIPAVAEQGIAVFIDVFCEPGVFSVPQAERILLKGVEFGLIPRLHADEFADGKAASLAARIGAKSADHLQAASIEGLEEMAKAGVVATLLPGVNLSMGKKDFPDAKKMIELGLKIAIATDFNPGSSPTQNLPLVAAFACAFMRVPPQTALAAITANAASALGMQSKIGKIEVGMQADLLGLRADGWADIFYNSGENLTALAIKKGKLEFEA